VAARRADWSRRALFVHIIRSGPAAGAAALLLLLLLQAATERWPAVGAALEYRRAAIVAEPWRLLTGHLIHVGWLHAVVNAVAACLVARLFAADLDRREQAAIGVGAALAISLGLAAFFPAIAWYRGLSGVLHALFLAGATTALTEAVAARPRSRAALGLAAALVAGAWAKVCAEQLGASPLAHAEWIGSAVVTQAHLIGAAAGTLAGIALALDRRRARRRGRR
jgi:rhomboid family GlyGly-CTERM serine protease